MLYDAGAMFLADTQLTANDVLRVFHRDEPFLFLGAAFTTVGLLCACLSLLRRRFDALLVWLALFAFLYGQRLWLDTRILDITLGGQELFGRIRWAVSFLTPIPGFLFFQASGLLPRRGKIFTGVLVVVFFLLAAATLALGRIEILHTVNNYLVIVALPVLLVRSWWRRNTAPDSTVMRWGLLCFIVLALWDNSVGAKWLHSSIEPYGFAVFLGCLGYVAARRTLNRDQELNDIQNELDLARRIQLSLLPAPFPDSDSFQVAARYVPMNSVAGDLYEFLVAETTKAGLLIADVSGHGVPAALIASMVKMAAISLRTQAAHPGELLTGMNRALCGNTQGQYVTAACVYFDTTARELRYAAAGHPAMLLLRDGVVTEIAENGLLLAAAYGVEYVERAVPIKPGDRFLLYTDGLVEARNTAGELFGEASLADALKATAALSASAATTAIVDEVQRWSRLQDDDLTALVCDFSRI
jgi:sigma-B regulation protein RsbU (phosphoserine phosphatase)